MTTPELPATTADLIFDAQRLGVAITQRLITDWVERGLLDSPERQGAGRGKGSKPALFPVSQRKLFALLIQKRKETRKIPVLARIPLYLWVYWGEDYVPVKQARRVLRTWADDVLKTSLDSARRNAVATVTQLAASDAPADAVRELTTLIERIGYQGFFTREHKLGVLLDIVIDPHRTGASFGPPGLTIDAATYMTALSWQYAAFNYIRNPDVDQVEEEVLTAASTLLRVDIAEYLSMQPQLVAASTPEQRERFQLQADAQQLVDGVGHDLLRAIGTILHGAEELTHER